MPRTVPVLFPATREKLAAFGERLRLARLRRRYASAVVAARAGISRTTLGKVEKGDEAVAFGTYARVLRVLGLDADLDLLARDDELGRKLQDLDLKVPRRAPRRKSP